MSTGKNKAAVRRIFEEAINKGNLAVVDEIMAANYVLHGPLGESKGPEGFKQMHTMMGTALPDLHCTIEDMVAEDDTVAARFNISGTFKGEMMGIAPTGKKLNIMGSVFVRFAGSKEVEAFEFFDLLAFYQQLGIKPPVG